MRLLLVSYALLMVMIAAAVAAELSDARKTKLTYLVRQDCGSCHGMTLKGGLGSALTSDRLAGEDTAALANPPFNVIPWQEPHY